MSMTVPQVPDLELKVEVIEDSSRFASMRDEWNELLTASRSNCLFLTWEWLYTWWKHLGEGKSLFIVALRSASQLVAIAPLTLTRMRVGPVAMAVLQFAGDGTIGSDYLDFIVRSDCEAEALTALTSFIALTGFSLRLSNVKEESAAAIGVSRDLVDQGWECLEVPMEVCPFIDLSGASWDSYLSSIGPKHRYNFKRRVRNLDKDFAVRVEQIDTQEDRPEALRKLVDLHLIRWRERGGSDAFDHPNLVAFHEEMSRLALERGWLRLRTMTLDGVVAAAFYCFRYRDTFSFYQSGIDPAFQQYSVGLVMQGLTIRSAIEEGAAEYDLLHGSESYKFLWATEVRRLVRLELYPPGPMGRMHLNAARLTAATKRFARRVLKSV